jgi:CRP-like cAMP-binding protein
MVVFNQGEYVFKLGDDAQAMYIISEGNVKI